MDDAQIHALLAGLRDDLDTFRRQVNMDITDLQGAIADLEDDYRRRRLHRPPAS